MFQALGLSPSEENLYTVLVHSPRSTVAELASYGSVSSQQATRDLHRLVQQGLANRLPGRQGRYIAVAPDIAIEPLLAKREDELRQAIESRVALSPDALTGLEANLRFGLPETMETRVFGRLSAWQNWIFIRPNAVGTSGALKVYGTGAPVKFNWERV